MKRTAFFPLHEKLGAKIVEFGGFDMPVLYTGIIEEHKAVRERVGVFDVSHMGEFEIRGPGALAGGVADRQLVAVREPNLQHDE